MDLTEYWGEKVILEVKLDSFYNGVVLAGVTNDYVYPKSNDTEKKALFLVHRIVRILWNFISSMSNNAGGKW